MKKQLTALALSALLFAAAASGCNQTETNTSAQQDPDPAALASALLEGGSFDDQLSETDQQAAMTVLGLDPEQVDQCTAYMGTGATPEEVAVIRATDASAAKEVAQHTGLSKNELYAAALEASLALGLAQGRASQLQRQQLERLLKMQLADQPTEEQYGLGCRLAKVQLELAEYAAAEQTLAELTARWPVRETPWLLRLRSAAARKDGAELARWLAEMERVQVSLSAAGRREVDFWKGGGQP